jgi:hypothetical protein
MSKQARTYTKKEKAMIFGSARDLNIKKGHSKWMH